MPHWRLLGELPWVNTREEIQGQSIAGWNPWKERWGREGSMQIVVPDPADPSRRRHVRTYTAVQEGEFRRFAYDLVGDVQRFYVPASPGEEGAFEAGTPRYEGHWRTNRDDDDPRPWPEPDGSWPGREAFVTALGLVEAEAEAARYRGYSNCRLCGCLNGTVGYRSMEWEWPEGLRHYVVDHLVRPSDDFVRFIEGSARS